MSRFWLAQRDVFDHLFDGDKPTIDLIDRFLIIGRKNDSRTMLDNPLRRPALEVGSQTIGTWVLSVAFNFSTPAVLASLC